MLEVMILVGYVIFVVGIGIKLYSKTDLWMSKLDRITPFVETYLVIKYGLFAFFFAVVLETLILFLFGSGSPLVLIVALSVGVGFIEEGAKLMPYFISKGKKLYRWHLTIKVALAFALIEAVLYGIMLFFSGNILGALLRIIVVMFHIAFTAIALADVLRGDSLAGYLKASVLHSLYDAPVLLALAESSAVVIAVLSIVAVVYTYLNVDEAFGSVYAMAKRELEERRRKAQEFWAKSEMGVSESDFTSSL